MELVGGDSWDEPRPYEAALAGVESQTPYFVNPPKRWGNSKKPRKIGRKLALLGAFCSRSAKVPLRGANCSSLTLAFE